MCSRVDLFDLHWRFSVVVVVDSSLNHVEIDGGDDDRLNGSI